MNICWRRFWIDYHDISKEHIQRYVTSEHRDKRPKERQPFGAEFHVFVFFVASPLTYVPYARGLRLEYKHLYFPPNVKVISARLLISFP